MNDENIEKLAEAREYSNILKKMLQRKKRNTDDEIKLAADINKSINDVLYQITGDEFYHKGGSL